MLRPVTYIPDPFRPFRREVFHVEAREGDTIRSAVPDLCGPDKVYLVHGRRCTDPDELLRPEDHLAVITRPQGPLLGAGPLFGASALEITLGLFALSIGLSIGS